VAVVNATGPDRELQGLGQDLTIGVAVRPLHLDNGNLLFVEFHLRIDKLRQCRMREAHCRHSAENEFA
jgi:hypothetical protein